MSTSFFYLIKLFFFTAFFTNSFNQKLMATYTKSRFRPDLPVKITENIKLYIIYLPAVGTQHMIMLIESAIKPVASSRHCQFCENTIFRQQIEIAVNGPQANRRIFGPNQAVNIVGRWMYRMCHHRVLDHLALFRVFQNASLILTGGFDLDNSNYYYYYFCKYIITSF